MEPCREGSVATRQPKPGQMWWLPSREWIFPTPATESMWKPVQNEKSAGMLGLEQRGVVEGGWNKTSFEIPSNPTQPFHLPPSPALVTPTGAEGRRRSWGGSTAPKNEHCKGGRSRTAARSVPHTPVQLLEGFTPFLCGCAHTLVSQLAAPGDVKQSRLRQEGIPGEGMWIFWDRLSEASPSIHPHVGSLWNSPARDGDGDSPSHLHSPAGNGLESSAG